MSHNIIKPSERILPNILRDLKGALLEFKMKEEDPPTSKRNSNRKSFSLYALLS